MTSPGAWVSLPAEHVSALARHALDTHDDDGPACCSRCCAPCHSLIALKASGTLDEILAADGPRHSWWDEETSQVSQDWLSAHIRPYCESGLMTDPGRCTDLFRDGDRDGEMLCALLAPWRCPDAHEQCRPQRVCSHGDGHDSAHSWEGATLSCLLAGAAR